MAHIPVPPGRLRQEDYKFQLSCATLVRLCLRKTKQNHTPQSGVTSCGGPLSSSRVSVPRVKCTVPTSGIVRVLTGLSPDETQHGTGGTQLFCFRVLLLSSGPLHMRSFPQPLSTGHCLLSSLWKAFHRRHNLKQTSFPLLPCPTLCTRPLPPGIAH